MERVYEYNYQKLVDANKLLKNFRLMNVLSDIFREESFFDFHIRLDENLILLFEDGERKMYLDLSDSEPVFIKKHEGKIIERAKLIFENNDVFVKHMFFEERPYGNIVTELDKKYKNCGRTEKEMVYLHEKRFIYKSDFLKKTDLESFDMNDVVADFKTDFKVELVNDESGEQDIYVEIDGNDVSYLFQSMDGKNVISRIYELYYGRINSLSGRDIYLIHLKKLEPDVFGLRQLKGISRIENELVGLSQIKMDKKSADYIKSFFLNAFGAVCNNLDSRIALLMCITQVEGTVYRDVEENSSLGIDNNNIISDVINVPKKRKLFKFNRNKKETDFRS